jgi:hypothetical protein
MFFLVLAFGIGFEKERRHCLAARAIREWVSADGSWLGANNDLYVIR